MARATPVTASLAAIIGAVAFVAAGRGLAAESQTAGVRVTSSDNTSRFMALGVSKSVVIDTPADIQQVLIADPGVVNAVVRSKRRAYLIGAALCQTNVYFFAADGRQIAAFDIAVTATTQSPRLEDYPFPAVVVEVYRAARGQILSCTPIQCIDANKPGSEQPPGTQNINVTGSSSTVSVMPK